jgi:hypothetical protein
MIHKDNHQTKSITFYHVALIGINLIRSRESLVVVYPAMCLISWENLREFSPIYKGEVSTKSDEGGNMIM